jgi:threonine dehydrogenase-like Zn-dependent dehydrogenase
MAEYLAAAAQNVHPIGGLDLKLACLAEPFGVAMHLFMSLEIDFLDDVLLIGPGPIGLLALAACKARGARNLTAVGRPPGTSGTPGTTPGARLEFATSLGAQTAVIEGEPADFLKRRFPEGFDKVILTAPPGMLPAAVGACRSGGIVAYCGLEGQDKGGGQVSWSAVHGRNIQIRPMGELPHHMPQALELLRRGVIDPRKFITHEFARDDVAQAFEQIERRGSEVVKAVVRVGAGGG